VSHSVVLLAVPNYVPDDSRIWMLNDVFRGSFIHFSPNLLGWPDNDMGSWIRTTYGFVRSTFENESILSNDTNGDSCERKAIFYLFNQAMVLFTSGVFQ